jgi:hypothetical protein
MLVPPRLWKFSSRNIHVRSGFATEVHMMPDLDQSPLVTGFRPQLRRRDTAKTGVSP